jgi:fibronectin-binding autotransporter adhesin
MKQRNRRNGTRIFQPRSKHTMRAAIAGMALATLSSGQAATVNASSGDGNLIITSSGADSYIADAGFVGPYTVNINSGVILTGNVGPNGSPLTISANDYSVTNAGILGASDATLSGLDIISGANLTSLTNSGTISGARGINGDLGVAQIGTLTNTGTISGLAGEGLLAGSNTTLTNSGTISGTSSAIDLDENATVTNGAGGTISGGTFGIITGNGANTITNAGTITGTGGTAIQTGTGNDTFNFNGGTINGNLDGGDGTDTLAFDGLSTLNGDILGIETGTKTGSGIALIDGLVNIQTLALSGGGFYALDGYTGDTINVTSGELGGGGTWNVTQINIQSGGAISPGAPNAVGTMAIGGELNFAAGSVYRADINPFTGAADVLVVNGDLNIAAGSEVQLRPTSLLAPIQDGSFLVVENNGPIGPDNFDSAAFSIDGQRFVSSSVTLTSNNVDGDIFVEVDHDYEAVAGLSGNGGQVAQYLNTLLPMAGDPGNEALAAYLGLIDYSNPGDAALAINQLDPSRSVAATDAILHSGHTLNRVIENHTAMVRAAAGGASQEVVTSIPAQYDSKGGMIAPAQEQYSTASAARNSTWGVWIAGSAESLDFENGLNEVDGDSKQVTIGLDFQAGPFAMGVFVQRSETDLDNGLGDNDAQTDFYGAYLTSGGPSGFFLDALLAYGRHDLEGDQNFVRFNNSSTADAHGWHGMLGGGFTMGAETFSWGPVAALEYQNLDVDDYAAGGFLNIQGRTVESLRSLVGLKAQSALGGGSLPVGIYASARWAYDFMADEDRSVVAGVPGMGTFTTTAEDRAKSTLVLNAGVNFSATQNIGLGIGYFGEVPFDGDGLTAHGGMIEAKISF